MRFFVVAIVVSVVVLQLGLPGVCRASYAFYVGNKLTADVSHIDTETIEGDEYVRRFRMQWDVSF